MRTTLFASSAESTLARNLSRLGYANPFGEERVQLERAILGEDFVAGPKTWTLSPTQDTEANTRRILARVEELLSALRARLRRGARPGEEQKQLCREVMIYASFESINEQLYHLVQESAVPGKRRWPAPFFRPWAEGLQRDLALVEKPMTPEELGHLFACFFQIRRAFHHIFRGIVGVSSKTARLRASVWESIFTHDLRRYERCIHAHLGELPTLVTGPSGSGKELVVRAVAWSRYIAFDTTKYVFDADFDTLLFPLNVSALPATLVESELFGHRRGAFTGAVGDRVGWLEACGPLGTVFLDEIGDLDPLLQVKLLRVLQNRTFQRLGETTVRSFQGKVITATHRDLPGLIAAGAFREDLYYRLCADVIETPSLAERIADSAEELPTLLMLLATRWLGTDEGPPLAREVAAWIHERLPPGYAWPGNVRELEQCMRSILVRREYHPPIPPTPRGAETWAGAWAQGLVTAEAMLGGYVQHVVGLTGSQLAAARRLGLDRRTVARYCSKAPVPTDAAPGGRSPG